MGGITKIGILGAGAIVEQAHLPALCARTDVRVQWLADVQQETAKVRAEKWGIPQWTADYRDVLADPEIEVVDICTPPWLHRQMTIEALRAGKHVLLEKPMGMNTSECAAIQAAANASTCRFMVAENWYFATAVTAAYERLRAGAIGMPYMLRCNHDSDFRLLPNAPDAHIGWFTLVGTHVVSATRRLIGEFSSVFAMSPQWIAKATDEPVPDTDLVLTAHIGAGVVGSFTFSPRSQHIGQRRIAFSIYGTEGLLEFEVWSGLMRLTRGATQIEELPRHVSHGYDEEIDHFLSCIRERSAPIPSAEDQTRTMAVIDAVYESLQAKGPRKILRESAVSA